MDARIYGDATSCLRLAPNRSMVAKHKTCICAVFLYSRAPGQGEEGEARPGWRYLHLSIHRSVSRMQVPKYLCTYIPTYIPSVLMQSYLVWNLPPLQGDCDDLQPCHRHRDGLLSAGYPTQPRLASTAKTITRLSTD